MIKSIKYNGNELRKAVAKKRIIELNISLRDAALQVDISPSTLSRCENGRQIDFDSFAKLCMWLQLEPSHFFDVVRERQDGFKSTYFKDKLPNKI